MNKSISFNSIKVFIRQIFNLVLQLLIITIIARYLGVEENGQYAILIMFPKFLSIILLFGIGPANIYLIGKKKYNYNVIYATSLVVSVLLIIIGLFIGFNIVYFFANILFPNINQEYLFLILLIFPFSFLFSIHLSFLQAIEDFNAYNIVSLSNGFLFLILILFLYIIKSLSLLNLICSLIISSIISFVISVFFVFKNKYFFSLKNFSIKCLKELLSYGLRAHTTNIVAFITYRADMFLLNLMLNSKVVGLYYIAVQIVEKLWIISSSMSIVLLPKLVNLKDKRDRLLLIAMSFRIAILLTVIISFFIIIFGYYFIIILFGEDYVKAYEIIVFLLPGVILGAGSSILANSIAAIGKPELNMYTSIVEMILNIVLNIVLIPIWGFIGAAISTSISYSVNTFLKIILLKRLEPELNLKLLFYINKNDLLFLFSRISGFKGNNK